MSYLYLYLIYLFLALAPIFIWLFFYYKKDLHPEPKKMILKVFLLGIVAACLVAVLDAVVLKIITGISLWVVILESFFVVALVEELAKYLVVKFYVFSSPELDEPLDVMLYMVVSALGFAALENMIIFFSATQPFAMGSMLQFALLRFIGAVFLHTLTSATIGFFAALSFCFARKKKFLFSTGFFIAVALHGVYNIAISEFTGFWQYSAPAIIIIILVIFTTYGFIKLKKLKSICKIIA